MNKQASQPSEAEIRAKALEEAARHLAKMADEQRQVDDMVAGMGTGAVLFSPAYHAFKMAASAIRLLAQQEQQAPAQTGEQK